MSNSRKLTETFYGQFTGIYDAVAAAPVVRSWRVRCAEELALSPGDTVVEMGCGTGANFPVLRERVGSEGTVVGVDLVPAMLRRARARAERHGWANVHVLRGDARRPPVATADALVSTFVVGMLGDPRSAVRSWLELVRPGGHVALLNAARTDRPALWPANLLFRAFTRLTAPGHRLGLDSPTRRLEKRWAESVDALFDETVDPLTDRLGLGFVVLASGRVPEG